MKKNGLELNEINSRVLPILEITDIKETASKHFNSNGFVLAYLTYGVYIGRYHTGEFVFPESINLNPDYIVRLRIFNETEELYIWKTKDRLRGRLRIDTEGDKTPVVDAYQVLWGTKKEAKENGWTRLYEDRGTELILPFANIAVDDKRKRIFIKTRNYIDFHLQSHLATYTDCRFVGFFDTNNNPLK